MSRKSQKSQQSQQSHSQHANKMLSAEDIKEYYKEYNQLFTELKNKLVTRVKNKLDDAKNFSTFVISAIVLLKEEAHTLHGPDKKDLAIALVESIVDNMTISDEDKAELKANAFPTLGNTIDLYIAAAKGYLFLQKVQDSVDDGCAKCTAKCSGGKCKGCKKTETKSIRSIRSGEATVEAPQTAEGAVDITALSNIVYDELRGMITNKQVSLGSIINIVTLTMQLIQQFAGVKGGDKKLIVISVINRVVAEFPMSDSDRAAVQAIVATTLDQTIDFVVAVANGEIDLLGIVEDHVSRCKAMCGC